MVDKKLNGQEKPQKSFDPIAQRLEWCVALADSEYNKRFWNTLPDEFKKLLMELIEWKDEEERDNILDMVCAIIENSEDVESELNQYFELRKEKQSDISSEQEKSDRNKAITGLKESVAGLDWEWKEYGDLLKRLKALNTKWLDSDLETEIQSILAELQNPQILLAVSLDLQEQDRQNGTHTFESFKSSIIALEPSFKDRFPEIHLDSMIALGADSLKNTRCTGKIIEASTDDGFMLKASLDCMERKISRSGSDYSLSSDIGAKATQEKAQKIKNVLKEKLKPLETSLTSIKEMKKHVEDASRQELDFDELKKELKTLYPALYLSCGLDMAESPEGILKLLSHNENMLVESVGKLHEEAGKAQANLLSELKARAEEKDAIKKETLRFFAQIGFDMFSQAETNAVFEWLNNNQAVMESLGANARFDIENGVLGYRGAFDGSDKLPLEWKRIFAKVFNKMVTGNVEYPVCFDEFGDCVFYETLEDAEAKRVSGMFNMKFFWNEVLWGGDRVLRMIENLRKEE